MFQQYITEITLLIFPVLSAVTFHELAHGYVAYLCGDPTAKNEGRLTLNPIKHLDPIGTIVFIVTRMIGWAKPVPINPAYFKNFKRDLFLVSLAGPFMNFILAFLAGIILKFIAHLHITNPFFYYKILLPFAIIMKLTVQINVALAFFNLLPVPPLDGSKILMTVLPENLNRYYAYLEPFGFIIILILVFTNTLDKILIPIISIFTHILT